MRLNLHTDYALRLLMFLASSGRQASVDEIAGVFGVSRHHLMKVAQQLTALGLVEARRKGTTVYYSIVRPEILTVVQALHDAFCPPNRGK